MFNNNNPNNNHFGPPHPGSQSVYVPNDDQFEMGQEIFSRRKQYGGVQQATEAMVMQNDPAMVIDYNHQQPMLNNRGHPQHQHQQQQRIRKRGRLNNVWNRLDKPSGPLPDPRINRLLPGVSSSLPCEVAPTNENISVKCEHPKASFKPEPQPPQLKEAAANPPPPPQPCPQPALPHLDRIEREKYEKSKNSRNATKGDRAVDLIKPVPRPTKDPALEDEINIVIEKLNVPVITTPANFTNYKIPRAPKGDAPSASNISKPASTVAPALAPAANKELLNNNNNNNIEMPSKNNNNNKQTNDAEKPKEKDKEKTRTEVPQVNTTNKPKESGKKEPSPSRNKTKEVEKELSPPPKIRDKAVECLKNKPVDRVRSSCDSRRDSSDTVSDDSDSAKKLKKKKRKRIISSSESETECSPVVQSSPVTVKAIASNRNSPIVSVEDIHKPVKHRSNCVGEGEEKGSKSKTHKERRESSSSAGSVNKKSTVDNVCEGSTTRKSVSSPSSVLKRKSSHISSEESESGGGAAKKHSGDKKRDKSSDRGKEKRRAEEEEAKNNKETEVKTVERKSREDNNSPSHKSKKSRSRRSRSSITDSDVVAESADEKTDVAKKSRRSRSAHSSKKSSQSRDKEAEKEKSPVVETPSPAPSPLPTTTAAAVVTSSDDSTPNPMKLLERLMNTDPEILRKIDSLLNGGTALLNQNYSATPQPPPPQIIEAPQQVPPVIPSTMVKPVPPQPLSLAALTVEVPKAQSPTISSCERMEELPEPSPKTPTHRTATPYKPVKRAASPKQRRRPQVSPISTRTLSRSVAFLPTQEVISYNDHDPLLSSKRTRKNELEKLQEDISRNFDLKYMMSDRSTKQAKDVAVPKKIARRRQSMYSSLSTENGAIKLTIIRDTSVEAAKPKSKMQRRMSVGNDSAPMLPFEDDIRNDDPFYDLTSGNCRLCTKTSSAMDAHYIQCHLNSEVFCCRLSYNSAMRLKSGESLNTKVNGDTCEYTCLLCNRSQVCSTYYDMYKHFTSHTGEFYYKCTKCDFRDVTMNKAHSRLHKERFEICPFPPLENNKLIAYMCVKCHFVQLQRSNINKHIVCHHRDESTKPVFQEIVLLDFGSHNLSAIDFDDLDGRFMVLPVIEQRDNRWEDFNSTFKEYMSNDASSLDGVVAEIEPDREEQVEEDLEGSFHIAVRELMTEDTKEVFSPLINNEVWIDNIRYNVLDKTFTYTSRSDPIVFRGYDKLKLFLEDLSEQNVKWSGKCNECDPITEYSSEVPAHMEVLHLRNVHWHQVSRETLIRKRGNAKVTNALRPWLPNSVNKSEADVQKMLSLPAILATYKCMADECSFFTNNMDRMENHLNQHDSDLSADDDALIGCCYCPAELESPSEYLTHVLDKHGTCQFFCPYCFYRSSHTNTVRHIGEYHPGKNAFVLDGKFNGIFNAEPGQTLTEAVLQENVKPNQCQGNE